MAIDLDQFVTGSVTSATSINVVFSSAVSSGSLIAVWHSQWGSVANHHFASALDNVNAGNYSVGRLSTFAGDTSLQVVIAYKLNISSGAGASTYRVSVNSSGANGDRSLIAGVFTGGPFTAGSSGSSQGQSSTPRGPSLTASSTPPLFLAAASHVSSNAFNNTISPGVFVEQLNPNNATGQILIAGYSTGATLSQQLTFGLSSGASSWVANDIVFMGLGAGGGAATPIYWKGRTLMGVGR